MFNKADIKFIKSLTDKNIRHANKLFVAEGSKSVADLLSSNLKCVRIYALKSWLINEIRSISKQTTCIEVTESDLERISSLQSTREVVALFAMPEYTLDPTKLKGLVLALDTMQDPGNLGTLIRLSDWYGIPEILCSKQTVDCYNSKVVQSTMGSLGRVKVHYVDLAECFQLCDLPVIAGSMEGKAARSYSFPQDMILLLGNEGSGIHSELKTRVTETIRIERRGSAESLNAAVAGAILVDRYFGQYTG